MPAEPTFAIEALLAELGFERTDSRQLARNALIEAGLTNSRKQNMALAKRDAAVAAIEERIARVDSSATCRAALEARGRRVVEVASHGCEVCGGSDSARAVQQMVADLVATGRMRLLVLGGSPATRRALREAVAGAAIDVRFVEGDRPTGAKRARELADSADVVVIWANTELDHKVSQPFATAAPSKTITVARRGIAALAEGVSRHVRGRR